MKRLLAICLAVVIILSISAPPVSANNLQAKLTAGDGAPFDGLGYSVSIDGDTALVGAYMDDDNTGSAYVFVRSGTTWTEQAKLTASDGAPNHFFGVVVSIDGDTALIAAVHDDDNGERSGSAYVFVRSGTTWTQQAKLTASDGRPYDQFGNYVALDGDTALVGASMDDMDDANQWDNEGSAYVFVRSDTTWTQQAKLTASDGIPQDHFGYSVSLDGDTALVGAPIKGEGTGSAYVFVRSDTTWTQQAKLTASDGSPGDTFGWSVSIDGDTALVGASGFFATPETYAGSMYVFLRSGTTWTEQAKLTAMDAAVDDRFGSSVSFDGNTALVGASGDDGFTGSAYLYQQPLFLLYNLIHDVSNVNMSQGIENSLDAKLSVVMKALNDLKDNDDVAAINALGAFVNEVQAQSGDKIPAENADVLISEARAIIVLLSSGA